MAHTALSVFESEEIPVIGENELELKVADEFAMINVQEFERVYSEKINEMKKRKLEHFEKLIIEYQNRFKV